MNVFKDICEKQNLASLDWGQFASLTKKRAEGKQKGLGGNLFCCFARLEKQFAALIKDGRKGNKKDGAVSLFCWSVRYSSLAPRFAGNLLRLSNLLFLSVLPEFRFVPQARGRSDRCPWQ